MAVDEIKIVETDELIEFLIYFFKPSTTEGFTGLCTHDAMVVSSTTGTQYLPISKYHSTLIRGIHGKLFPST